MSQQALIGHLVNLAINALAMDYLTANAGALAGDVRARLAKLFDAGQYEESLYAALDSEAEIVDRLAEKWASASPQETRKDIEEWEFDLPPTEREQLVAWTRELAELYREYVRVLSGPEAQYRAWLEKLSGAQEANPVIRALWPAWDGVVDRTRAAVVQRAMISAGLAFVQEGPNALLNHLDPASGEPFVYRETADGLELESAYRRNDKPVTIFFRTR